MVESPTGVRYKRNTSHVKRYETNGTRETHRAQDGTQGLEDTVREAETHTPADVTLTSHQDTETSDAPRARPQRLRRSPERLCDVVLK